MDIQRGDVSLKQVKLGLDYDWSEDVSLLERPFFALSGTLNPSTFLLGHPQSLHRDAFIGSNIDTHDEWWENTTNHKYPRNLAWKKYYFPAGSGDPVDKYPGDVDIIDRGNYFKVKTRVNEGLPGNVSPISVETWNTGYIEQSGTFRVSGVFDNIQWQAFNENGLRQEEFHVYVIQSSDGILEGTTQNTFAWVYNGGSTIEDNWTDKNAIHELGWQRRPNSLKINYTFEMNNSLPYVILLVRQMSKTQVDPSAVTTSEWRDFKLEQIA